MYKLIDSATAPEPVKTLLEATQKQLGRLPNLYRAMANSPHALAAYLAFRGELQNGGLDSGMQERIALLVAQLNACDYCIAAHNFRGQKLGLAPAELNDVRLGRSSAPKIHAALTFVAALHEGRGQVEAELQDALFQQGWTEADVGEMVALVALNVFSNYFKHIATPALDFPQAPELIR